MSTDFDRLTSNDVEMGSTNQNQAEKRAHHNALERKRRDHIKGSFGELRDVIPLLKGEKVRKEDYLFTKEKRSDSSGIASAHLKIGD